MSKYDYEYEYDPIYCYPNSDVLRNMMDIRDQDRLSKIERGHFFHQNNRIDEEIIAIFPKNLGKVYIYRVFPYYYGDKKE